MNENNNSTQILQTLVYNFEVLNEKGEVGSFNKDEFEQLINFYKSNNNIDKALEITEQAIDQFQYIIDFYLLKSELLLQNNVPEEALTNIVHCEQLSPYSYEVKLLKAKALSMKGEIDSVHELLNELKTFSKLNYNTEFSIIYSYLNEFAGEYEKMFNNLKDALIIDPSNIEALERINIATVLTKKYEESLRFHLDIIDDEPYNYHAWYNLGQIYSVLSEYEDAIDSLEYSFIINPNFELGYLEYADLCLLTCNFEKAAIVYEEYLERFEGDSEVYVNLIDCYIKLKKYKKAKDCAITSIKLDPFNDEAYFHLGQVFQKMKNWQKALNAFHKAMEIDPDREEYIYGVTEMYLKLNDLKKAEQYFDMLVDTYTPEEDYYVKYILFLLDVKKANKARQIIKIAEEAAYSPLFNYLSALVKFRLDKRKEALLQLDIALSESIESHKMLFKWAPELKSDPEVLSAIKYYKK